MHVLKPTLAEPTVTITKTSEWYAGASSNIPGQTQQNCHPKLVRLNAGATTHAAGLCMQLLMIIKAFQVYLNKLVFAFNLHRKWIQQKGIA